MRKETELHFLQVRE